MVILCFFEWPCPFLSTHMLSWKKYVQCYMLKIFFNYHSENTKGFVSSLALNEARRGKPQLPRLLVTCSPFLQPFVPWFPEKRARTGCHHSPLFRGGAVSTESQARSRVIRPVGRRVTTTLVLPAAQGPRQAWAHVANRPKYHISLIPRCTNLRL